MEKEKKTNIRPRKVKPRIVVIPHYVGTRNVKDVFRNILNEEVMKKIDKTA